ncbi:MAG: hypothetical protein LBQ48_07725 [Oscillospiraceae bacterium]|jgi:NRPS condensation-like uncharacterized protein|nr:hypothetical protein [Oscillospiraceae bacterium]
MNDPAQKAWYKLDNAAKIFPPTSGKSDTRVFRFSCELREGIDESLLQAALDSTMDDFPGFRTVLKPGMFWYYLEQSGLRPLVHREKDPPCSTIYLSRKTLLFDVTWYGKRINLEVYHALTDGTGALQFLKTLVLDYLKLAHPDTMAKAASIDYDASQAQKMTDSFNKYYDRSKKSEEIKGINGPANFARGSGESLAELNRTPGSKKRAAYQLKGAKEAEWRMNIIEGSVSAGALLAKAREYGATVTAFITALLMRAIREEMSAHDAKKPVVITVPVNLRQFFDSKSTRNFFSLIDIVCDFQNNNGTLEEVIACAKECFARNLNVEYLQTRLNKLLGFERNLFVRLVPLTVKNLCMSIAYSFASREVTAAVSNLGRIRMPDETNPYIRLFDIFTSTEKLQICFCSYEDNMNISFTSPFVNTDIQRRFFRQLTKMGLAVEIEANAVSDRKLRIES